MYDTEESGRIIHLSENVADFKDLKLGAQAQVLLLLHAVGHHHLVKGASVDALDGVAAQDTMGDQGINLGCALLLEELGGPSNRVRGVRQVIDQNGYPVTDVTDQHHGGILAVCDLGRAALL
jgi:hypothetical protein